MRGGLVTDASGARSYLSRSRAHRAARHPVVSDFCITINGGKVERERAGMKASLHAGESDMRMREISRRNCGGATGVGSLWQGDGARRGVVALRVGAGAAARRRRVATGGYGPVGRAGAYFNPAHCTDRFAKPSVMQGAPLPTRCSLHRRKEKWNAAQWCGRARRLCTPATPVKCL